MKSKKNLLEQLDNLPHFTKSTIYQLGSQLGLKNSTVNTYISRFLRRKEILPLKRSLYISTEFFSRNKSDISYSLYLANIIRTPSYVSSWTALQYYNLTTEAIRSITSVTPKVTRDYETKAGTFSYQSIQKGLFSDYSLVKGKFDFFIASPSKALFDLLYFRTRQFRGVEFDDVKKMVEELRIDIDEMDEVERNKFYEKIKAYLHE
jgi:predicted transcriptional regulator of viral defense system